MFLSNETIAATTVVIAPSILLAMVLSSIAKGERFVITWLFVGVVAHESLHLLVATLTNGRPVKMGLIPKKNGEGQLTLGQVTCTNIRWYNAAFIGLAPILAPLIPIAIALTRGQQLISPFSWTLPLFWVVSAPIWPTCIPSKQDIKVACHSLPAAILIAGILFALKL